MSYENIKYEKNGPIATVTLNRPEKLNALSNDLQLEVRDYRETLPLSPDLSSKLGIEEPDCCE
ncbi:MAG: hypothetical protein QGF09_14395, partial [Rhodospirillales bacterium]|nr:hypothetical protein [Rhodospirillales bacterium]